MQCMCGCTHEDVHVGMICKYMYMQMILCVPYMYMYCSILWRGFLLSFELSSSSCDSVWVLSKQFY